LIDSELFGHERGAFTGAHTRAPGRLAEAHGGTLFLDEVAELPLDVQGKLLRFVQDKEFTPVGSSRPRTVEVRIIAATNVDLEARLAEGRFREDLYHRLNVVHLRVPPLRERREDILLLARLFVKQAAALYGKESLALSAAAEAALQAYSWPGNVRELQNRITQAVLLGEGLEIRVEGLGGLARAEPASAKASPRGGGPEPATGHQRLSAIGERLGAALGRAVDEALRAGGDLPPVGRWVAHDLLRAADELAGGVGRRAAQTLGIPETTFRRRQRDSAAGGPRPASWSEVLEALRQAVLHGGAGGSPDTDLHRWAESCLLDEILARAPEESAAAALLGVSQPTLVRRAVKYRLSRTRSLSEKPAQTTPHNKKRRAENSNLMPPGSGLYRNT
jgi:DNA-binding NtrC family response regulator